MSLQFDVAPAYAVVVVLAEVWLLERRKGPGVELSGNRSAILTVSGDKYLSRDKSTILTRLAISSSQRNMTRHAARPAGDRSTEARLSWLIHAAVDVDGINAPTYRVV